MYQVHQLEVSFNGLKDKIAYITGCYPSCLYDPRLRAYVEKAAGKGSRLEQMEGLYNAIRRDLAYLPDPVGAELTKRPEVILDEIGSRGHASGDCDDHACFSYCALLAMGVPARLRVLWRVGPMPVHIYAVASFQDKLYAFDTTRLSGGFGNEGWYTRKMDFEGKQ